LNASKTVTGDDENWGWDNYSKNYGSSMGALNKVAEQKGYSYVYHLSFTDIFYVRNDILPEELKGIEPEQTYDIFNLHGSTIDGIYNFKSV
jgi:hypothetical protein